MSAAALITTRWTPEDWRVFYDERAGIAEFDGELDRAEAERQAFEKTITRWMNTHLPEGLDPDTCAACGHPIGEIGKAAITIWRGAMMEDLTEQFENVLESCFESGMQVPLILAAVALNGSVLVVRFVWNESHVDLDSEVLAKHLEDTGLTPPINIMVVDSVGEGACVLIEQKGFKYLH